MNNVFSTFTRCYPVSKTLRFALIPQGKTEENIQKYGMLSKDEEKAVYYPLVKEIFDQYHKAYIEDSLSAFVCDWTDLFEAFDKYSKDKLEYEKLYNDTAAKYQKKLSDHLKKKISEMDPEKIIKNALSGDTRIPLSESQIKSIRAFSGFSTYFEGYRIIRSNIYTANTPGSIAYRIVCENFPKFYWNCKTYNSLNDGAKALFNNETKELTGSLTLDEIFSPECFNYVLSQNGVDFYNTVIGGKTDSETSKKQGLNELCNLAYQSNKIPDKKKFSLLYKQILSDRESASFIPTPYDNDKEVKRDIITLCEYVCAQNNEELHSAFSSELSNHTNIYVDKKQLSVLSQVLYDGDWNCIYKSLYDYSVQKLGEKASRKIEQYIDKKKVYTLSELESALSNNNILVQVWKCYEDKYTQFNKKYEDEKNALSDENAKILSFDSIKGLLDSIQEAEKILKIFSAPQDAEKDAVFYDIFDEVHNALRSNITVYNKVRNYATQKPYSEDKIKLNFDSPTLANGWDQNKEYQNNAMLFFKDNKYYLGILNAKNKIRLTEEEEHTQQPCFKKLVYKLLPDPNKMLPKVFFSKKGLETYTPSDYILDGYNQGKHKKGDAFDISFCHELIDFFKDCIASHPDWSKFDFIFSDTSTYEDISGFYREVEHQGYKLSFSNIPDEVIYHAIDEGNLFLFEIYSKDFSEKSTGKPNLHTLYFRELFSDENIENPVLKLNGGAELFYRAPSIPNPFTHKKGSVLINKRDVNGDIVEENIYQLAAEDAKSQMSITELKEKYPFLSFREAPHNITKDKRYSKPAYRIHLPITLNNATDVKYPNFNSAVLNALEKNEDVNIIGIDRGERNLLCVSVIDQSGKILDQKSLNIINGIDYHKKLDTIEKRRDEERKNWHSIENIKEMKNGYLSSAVHEVTELMLKYNAIVVLEDLNFGFKRGRFHIEKQVYQKFEKMLIDKLNYLADKSKIWEMGGIANAYQLTSEFKSFQMLGKQSGFLFYVPARYTSKIDPATGFVNLFTSEQLKYTSSAKTAEFFGKFGNIAYDEIDQCYRFDFAYSSFNLKNTDYRDMWSVYTAGNDRVNVIKKDSHFSYERVNVTERISSLLEKYAINKHSPTLHKDILKVDDKEFWQTLSWLFKLTVTLRHEDDREDFILSPIKSNGTFYDSRKYADTDHADMPVDADTNGAYHIALQGLRMLKHRIKDGKIQNDDKGMQNYNWLKFAQERHL